MALATDEALVARLKAYVSAGASSTSEADEDYLTACVAESKALVVREVGSHTVPDPVLERAIIEAGSELYNRRSAPNGVAQFATADGSAPVRVARDPMVAARPILAPFLPLPFA